MSHFFLDPARWPSSLPQPHRRFLSDAVRTLSGWAGLAGLAVGGSFSTDTMDEYSDLDLKVIVDPGREAAVAAARMEIARALGELLVAFPAGHIGIPKMLICLYGSMPLHVDIDFVVSDELWSSAPRPVVLWDRDGIVRHPSAEGGEAGPSLDRPWIEDRFWVWIHCALTKVGRGELFAALEYLSFIREKVLGPMVHAACGSAPNGTRRIEQSAAGYVLSLQATVARYDRAEILEAIRQEVRLYRSLRTGVITNRVEAEAAVTGYLEGMTDRR